MQATTDSRRAGDTAIAWHADIDRDVIRGRRFDYSKTFLPAALSLADELSFLTSHDKRLLSHVQGRTYVALQGVLRLPGNGAGPLLGRVERMLDADMPPGYVMTAGESSLVQAAHGRSRRALLALGAHIEQLAQLHYRAEIEPQPSLCPLWKDVMRFRCEQRWPDADGGEPGLPHENMRLDAAGRDAAAGALIALLHAVDVMLQGQAAADAAYFCSISLPAFSEQQSEQIRVGMLEAYRWQHIVSGLVEPLRGAALFSGLDDAQVARIRAAVLPAGAA